jgi:hypothetical protein
VACVTFFELPFGMARTCNYCNETSHPVKPACVEQHLAHVRSAIRCCPGVCDDVKANVKQIIEGKAAPKVPKKQSDPPDTWLIASYRHRGSCVGWVSPPPPPIGLGSLPLRY